MKSRWHTSFGTASYLQPCRSDHFCPLMTYWHEGHGLDYSVASRLPPKRRGLSRPQQVSFAVEPSTAFRGNQNDTADNDQNYS